MSGVAALVAIAIDLQSFSIYDRMMLIRGASTASIFAVLAVCLCFSACSGDDRPGYLGSWVIDVEASMARAKVNKAYPGKSDDELHLFYVSRMAAMRIEITESEIVLYVGENGVLYPYTLTSSNGDNTSLAIQWNGEKHSVAIRQIDEDSINTKWSVQPDFDHAVWRRKN